ncbi:homoserine dehydrogenase [Neptunicella marina]|uniref:Homoserine dehydrogenase n=1 Tax=Neptunicella marina TaxID=2125989 RepID=A0A8J6LYG0_9ALTE|nr:homoserine dehydrogenase [Neptunicella marina]MBC3765335.1 homoserine dehydrogenase [Neptunicella marina]
MSVVRIAVSGFGAIGLQVAKLLLARQDSLKHRYEKTLLISGVCGSKGGVVEPEGLSLEQLDKKNFVAGLTGMSFIQKVEADILIEAGPSNIQTGQPGFDYGMAALDKNMHLVFASKGALVCHYASLIQTANNNQKQIKLSAATASAMPTIDFVERCLAGATIKKIEAILTGTSNLILTDMLQSGSDYKTALHKAQQLGIADPDPSFDVEGWDTASKLVIMAARLFNTPLDIQLLAKDSLTDINKEQVMGWQQQGLQPRLIASIDFTTPQPSYLVKLKLYDKHDAFYAVNGATKAIWVDTEEMGCFYLTGGTSNPLATAAAVVKDIEQLLMDKLL